MNRQKKATPKEIKNYYHCSTKCRVRFKGDVINKLFNTEIVKYMPFADVDKLYVELIGRK